MRLFLVSAVLASAVYHSLATIYVPPSVQRQVQHVEENTARPNVGLPGTNYVAPGGNQGVREFADKTRDVLPAVLPQGVPAFQQNHRATTFLNQPGIATPDLTFGGQPLVRQPFVPPPSLTGFGRQFFGLGQQPIALGTPTLGQPSFGYVDPTNPHGAGLSHYGPLIQPNVVLPGLSSNVPKGIKPVPQLNNVAHNGVISPLLHPGNTAFAPVTPQLQSPAVQPQSTVEETELGRPLSAVLDSFEASRTSKRRQQTDARSNVVKPPPLQEKQFASRQSFTIIRQGKQEEKKKEGLSRYNLALIESPLGRFVKIRGSLFDIRGGKDSIPLFDMSKVLTTTTRVTEPPTPTSTKSPAKAEVRSAFLGGYKLIESPYQSTTSSSPETSTPYPSKLIFPKIPLNDLPQIPKSHKTTAQSEANAQQETATEQMPFFIGETTEAYQETVEPSASPEPVSTLPAEPSVSPDLIHVSDAPVAADPTLLDSNDFVFPPSDKLPVFMPRKMIGRSYSFGTTRSPVEHPKVASASELLEDLEFGI